MLAHERLGSGEPLVLLHGIAHHRQAWYPVVARLAEEYEVILVDLPGHGESPPLRTAGRSPGEAVRAELLAFFDEQGLNRPHVAGNSLGGWFALELAARDAVRSVTALSPGGFWYGYGDFAYTLGLFGTVLGVATLVSPLAPWLLRRPWGRAALFFWVHRHPTRLTPERATADFGGLMRARRTVLRFIAAGRPYDQFIPSRIPATVGWADWDMVLPRYQARRARYHISNGEHIRLRDCGHVPMADDPEQVAEIIRATIRRTAPS